MDYKKIYCDKWKAAYTSNTVNDSDSSCVELRWKNVPLGELFCGPAGVVFTKLYRFKGDPELTKIQAFPDAEKEFNALLKNIETMEYICQLWEEVKTSDLEVDFFPWWRALWPNTVYQRFGFLRGAHRRRVEDLRRSGKAYNLQQVVQGQTT